MTPTAKYGDPVHRPRRLQLAVSKAEFLDPPGLWQKGFCQALLASTWEEAVDIEPDEWDDMAPDWLAYPWLTFVVGSGALSVPAGFVEQVNLLPGRWPELAEAVRANPEWPHGKPRSISVGDRIADAQEFLEELIGSRLHARVADSSEAADPSLTYPTISNFTTALILAVSTLTRTYHELSIVLNTPLDRWGRDTARAGPTKPSERRRAMRDWADVRAFLGYLRKELDSAPESWARQTGLSDEVQSQPFEVGEAGSLRSLLDEIETQFEEDVLIEAEQIRLLTALVWHRLLKELSPSHYPGWTDLLMRLVLQNERALLSHRQPRWTSMNELNTWVETTIVPTSGLTWGADRTVARTELDPEVQSFYDALADCLWGQARVAEHYRQPARPPVMHHAGVAYEPLRAPESLPLASAYVTSFDMELERSLWRTIARGDGRTSGSFSIVFPVYRQNASLSRDGEFYWLEKIVTVDTERDPDGTFWFRDTTNRGAGPAPKFRIMHSRRTDLRNHPYIVRLGGCPGISIPPVSQLAADPEFLADFRELNDQQSLSGVFVHSLTVDEYLALRQVETEQVWRSMNNQQSRTLPERMRLSTIDGPTRSWALLGIQLRDPAVRLRLLSLFNQKFTQQPGTSSSAPDRPEDVSSHELRSELPPPEQAGLLPPERESEVSIEKNPVAKHLPDPPTLCGFALNVHYDDDEVVLLDSLNLTAVKERAQAMGPEFEHYARHLHDHLASCRAGADWHRPGWAGCHADIGEDVR